ncbi:MAG: tetratricopeptide repeat protein [Bacteroidia bacterium]
MTRIIRYISLLIWAVWGLGSPLFAQSPLDSMERLLPTLTGQEKINMAGELAFQYCYVNTDKAFHYGKMELDLAQELGDSAQIAQAWNDLAAAFISSGDFEQSLALNRKALAVRERVGDSLKVAATLGRMGYALVEIGSLDEALTTMIRAAHIYETENKPQYLGMMFNHIGAVHQRQENHPKAIEYFQKSISIAEENKDVVSSIAPRSNLGKEYFEQGRHEEAQAIFLRLTGIMDSLGIQENAALIKANLGSTYMAESQYDSALYYFTAADTLYQAKGDKKGLASIHVDMGLCYTKMQAYDKAEKALLAGLKYAEETASNWQLRQVFDALYQFEYAKGNYKAAADYLGKSLEYQRMIHNETVNERVAEMETKYQTEKKEKDLAVRSKQLADSELKAKTQQLWIFLLSGGLLLVLGLVVLLVRNQRLRRERLEQRSRMDLQEERLRISRDLHDHIGAELTLITSSLDSLAAGAADAAQGKELQEIGGFSRNAMSQLRETIWAIRSETISVDSLSLRLMDYAAKLCKPAGIVSFVRVDGDADKSLSPTHTIHVYRLCQEAIHNAVKYANCRKLDIVMEVRPGWLEVRVVDDGKGFRGGERGDGQRVAEYEGAG